MVKLFSATAAIGVLATTTAFTASSAAPAGPYTAQADSDRITSLPGWPAGKPFPSNMYSGYIDVGKKSGVAGKIHYWFIESQNSPKDDPVVYWTNGGPGGSGISTGLLTEMGALQLNEDSLPAGIESDSSKKVVPNLLENDYAWSKVANMLYVSQPKGVGFSYCPDGERACQNNDVSAAQDAYEFFVNFFERFPSLKKNDFYLTAESYGGIYLPMFMDEIDRNGGVPNFKGAAIGDGCWGTAVGTCAFSTGKSHEINVEFFQGHGMYDQELYKRIKQSCGSFSDDDVQKKDCKADLDEMQTKIGKFDIYNIYDTCQAIGEWKGHKRTTRHNGCGDVGDVGSSFFCPHDTDNNARADTPHAAAKRRMAKLEATGSADLPTLAAVRNHVSLGGALNDFACGGGEHLMN